MGSDMLDAALAYAQKGYAVFPCKADKSPYIFGGFKNAAKDQDQIRKWWSTWPDAMIGLPTGKINNLWALDVDVPKQSVDPDGRDSIAALQNEHGKLPDTMHQKTPSGGEHYIFLYPADYEIHNSVKKIAPGLDVRGEGGYIIIAPSRNETGNYEFILEAPLADAPEWLIEKLKKLHLKPLTEAKAQTEANEMHPYIESALESAMRNIANSTEGSRNDTLYREVAGLSGFIPNGFLDEQLLRQRSQEAYRICNPEDCDKEFEATFQSSIERGKQTPREIPAKLPARYSLTQKGNDAGVWYEEQTKTGEKTSVRVGAPLIVRGWIRNERSENWSRLVEWNDPDGIRHSEPVSEEILASTDSSAWRKLLASGGYQFAGGKKNIERIGEYIVGCQPVMRFMGVNRTGWHENSFVLPDRTITNDIRKKIIMYNAPLRNPYQISGTLAEWQDNVGKLATGNSRLIFALCAAFAPPLLRLLGQESAGFNFVGPSSTGKSTALYVAASVWGKGTSGDGYVSQWRTTDNGLEAQAALHSDTLLCLDEMSQASPRVISEAAYMLGNNQGKTRANRKGDTREIKNWRVLFLSTGEQGLESKLLEEGKKAKAGQAIRLLDIPADAGADLGLFENIGATNTASQFADLLRNNSAIWYGTAGRAFIERLIRMDANARIKMAEIYKSFCDALCTGCVDGQVKRAANKFALCWIAGFVAAFPGQQTSPILPIDLEEIERSIKSSFAAWVEHRGGTGAWETSNLINTVKAFIQTQCSRFAHLGDSPTMYEGSIANRAGFKRTDEQGTIFYVFPEVFKKEICNGMQEKDGARLLYEAGMLLAEDGRLTRKLPRKVDGLGRPRMYALRIEVSE